MLTALQDLQKAKIFLERGECLSYEPNGIGRTVSIKGLKLEMGLQKKSFE